MYEARQRKKLTKQIQFFTMDEQFCDLFLVGHYSPYITSDSEWIHHCNESSITYNTNANQHLSFSWFCLLKWFCLYFSYSTFLRPFNDLNGGKVKPYIHQTNRSISSPVRYYFDIIPYGLYKLTYLVYLDECIWNEYNLYGGMAVWYGMVRYGKHKDMFQVLHSLCAENKVRQNKKTWQH